MKTSTFQHNLKIIIYIILLSAIVVLWFLTADKARSLKNSYLSQAQENAREIAVSYEQKLAQSPKDAIELGVFGENLVNKGYTNFGLLALEEAIKRNGDIRDLNLYTAKVYFDAKNTNRAKELALKAQAIDPLYAPTYSLLGEIYTSLDDTQNAEICYNKAKDFSR